MIAHFSNPGLKSASRNWYFLTITGLFSLISGLYLLIIPSEIYRILASLFEIAFITIGLSGIIFSAQDRESIQDIMWYFRYTLIVVVTGICTSLYTEETLTFVTGFISLYCYIRFLATVFGLKEYKSAGRIKLITINILGIVYSILFITLSLADGAAVITMHSFCFILYGITAVMMSLEQKRISKIHTNNRKK
ncbi:hypothetical protein OZ664_03330 [Elizabethkingia sp. HX WHF]|uniref:hypothetical protein n=1 Tax=Elizabethkingia TaxID=308865 RepID=UPI00099945DC|nr:MULTISPECIES: hypothetical protein [Elizabethkingia]ATL42391.1 hypothetical protein CQS02_03265 [Elizabethkingia miricola]MCL1638871.1 hypothetical protein [Elizabethkingia bruuniana]MDX8563019.1 hypothetical protein [Elizabethkingia sp. HX WHF]OPC22475.1 hypothetical protein BAY00_18215 [Elizabethkingia bruuniana]